MIQLHHGECEKVLPTIETSIVDCVVIDPPYFGIVKDEWDNQWKTREDFIDWLEKIIIELKRVLKSNGSLYIFADDKICAYVQVMIDKHLTLLNSIVWHKTNNLPIKNAHLLRSYAPMTERILFYTTEICKTGLQIVGNDLELYKPIRDYFKNERSKTSLSYYDINKKCFGTACNGGGMASNILTSYKKGWSLPTKEMYQKLQTVGICQKPYEEIKEIYDRLRIEYENIIKEHEKDRRTFKAGNGRFDVIQEKIITRKENTSHSTTKPTRLIKQLIEASTNKGDLVLDCFMGSGTTGISCKYLDRSFIGIEKEKEFFELSTERINGSKVGTKKNEPIQVSF